MLNKLTHLISKAFIEGFVLTWRRTAVRTWCTGYDIHDVSVYFC